MSPLYLAPSFNFFSNKYLRNEVRFAADVKQQALPPHLPLAAKETTKAGACAGTRNNDQLGFKNKFGTRQHKSYLSLT